MDEIKKIKEWTKNTLITVTNKVFDVGAAIGIKTGREYITLEGNGFFTLGFLTTQQRKAAQHELRSGQGGYHSLFNLKTLECDPMIVIKKDDALFTNGTKERLAHYTNELNQI